MMKIGVLLSGCGVYDGSEIQEAVSVLIALDELGVEACCIAPDLPQRQVIDHLSGKEMAPERNQLQEAARIARGSVVALERVDVATLDGLVIPGGFGVAKNLCGWAFDGPAATINPAAARLIQALSSAGKPIAALCVAPVLLALALRGSQPAPRLTLGTPGAASPYDIPAFHAGVASLGMETVDCALGEVVVDPVRRLVSSPCYMLEASPAKILSGVRKACAELVTLAGSPAAYPLTHK